jgi:hypothetical protein
MKKSKIAGPVLAGMLGATLAAFTSGFGGNKFPGQSFQCRRYREQPGQQKFWLRCQFLWLDQTTPCQGSVDRSVLVGSTIGLFSI